MRNAATKVVVSLLAVAMTVSSAAQAPSRPRVSPENGVRFEEVARVVGVDAVHTNGASPEKYLVETMGSGAVLFDVDDDGWLDLFVVDGGSLADEGVAARARHRFFHNQRNGTFRDVTAASGIRHAGYGMGACAGDVDNDGRIDLYVTNYGTNTLYRNEGTATFADVTKSAGVGLAMWSSSCAFLDVDRDGDLDLFVTNYLDAPKNNNRFCGDPRRRIRVYCHPLNYPGQPNVLFLNDGRGVFKDASVEAGISGFVGNGLGVAVGDYDDDGWPDVFVANDGVPDFLFHNEGRGRFSEVALLAGVSVGRDGKARAGMGTEFADFDGDGRLDLVVTNHEFETHSLFRNDGSGTFVDVTIEAGLASPTLPFVGFGVAFLDVDNDGNLDLSITNGHVIDNTALFRAGSTHAQRKLLFRNTNGRRFAEVGRQAGSAFARDGVGRALVAGDIDNDGDIDLVVTNNGGAIEVVRNEGGTKGSALLVRLKGVRGNRDGLGARVTLVAGTRTQVREVKSGSSYLGQNDLRVHFGLAGGERIDRLDVRWPGGPVEAITGVVANEIITITEGRGVTSRARMAGR